MEARAAEKSEYATYGSLRIRLTDLGEYLISDLTNVYHSFGKVYFSEQVGQWMVVTWSPDGEGTRLPFTYVRDIASLMEDLQEAEDE